VFTAVENNPAASEKNIVQKTPDEEKKTWSNSFA